LLARRFVGSPLLSVGADTLRRVGEVLEGLNEAQRRAVTTDAAPLCILAGAGSGKTRVLTRRIAHRIDSGSAGADHVLALTFTRKAAGELTSRLRALGVPGRPTAGTFHAVAYAQLRRRWADRGEPEPALLDRKVRLLAPLIRGAHVEAADIAGEIEWAKARMINPSAYADEAARAGRDAPLPPHEVADLYAAYEKEKRRRGLVDFDDLLFRLAKTMEDDESFGAAQRWRFRHVFVDEFQDVNPVQHHLLMAWVGDGRDLCVVGDPNQAIYAWNGADSSYLLRFERRFPTAEVVRLDDNYRSSPQILAAANAVLADAWARTAPHSGRSSARSPSLKANRPDGPLPRIRSYPDEVAEAEGVVEGLREAHRPGIDWSTMAVLVRTNAQTVPLERALTAAGIPVRVRGDGAFLHQPEVRQAMNDLGTGRLGDRVDDVERRLPLIAPEERRANVEALVTMAREYLAADPAGTAAGFSGWITAALRHDAGGDTSDAVDVVTFHRAKGLEWPVVYVCGLERGLVPIGRAETTEERAEERRLLYVALTRAERELHCTWAMQRTFGSRTSTRQPSPWLDVIQTANGGSPTAPVTRPRAPVVRLKGEPDSPLLSALKVWRLERSRAASLPAYVIFPDKTLVAIAERMPASEQELLAVPGVGPMKLATWGEDVLRIVAAAR
jgi:DNA helicase-2/ATP-dependent DNA helicase PcrA